METKSLLYGLIGFFLGGLLVSGFAALEKSSAEPVNKKEVSMSQMTNMLKNKKGDDYDKTFITHMIDHHKAAVDMAKLSETRAKHQEIKDLSNAIVSAQEKEIGEMQQWENKWGYNSTAQPMQPSGHSMH